MAKQFHLFCELKISNQVFEPWTLRSFACNHAQEVGTCGLEFVAAAQQESVVFGDEPATASIIRGLGSMPFGSGEINWPGKIHAEPLHQNLFGRDVAVTTQNEAPVKFRDRYAESATLNLTSDTRHAEGDRSRAT